MRKAKDNKQAVRLVLVGDGSGRPFVGVHEVAGRLPALARYPNESAEAFTNRALHHCTGSGAMYAMLAYQPEREANQ